MSVNEKVSSCKCVIVNAYYDDDSQYEVERIADLFGCDFISIENKGYSYGNNRGMEYALNHYDFDYIVVSNPDVVIEKFDDRFLDKDFEYDIIAPNIIAASGHSQNPAFVRRSFLAEYLIYKGYKKDRKLYLISGLLISKIMRVLTLSIKRISQKHIFDIYCAHGSFLLLSRSLIVKLAPVYDENIFLFGEEGVLAYKSKKDLFKTCYSDYIIIKHKEDGSMKLSNLSINGEMRKSNIYFYENYLNK